MAIAKKEILAYMINPEGSMARTTRNALLVPMNIERQAAVAACLALVRVAYCSLLRQPRVKLVVVLESLAVGVACHPAVAVGQVHALGIGLVVFRIENALQHFFQPLNERGRGIRMDEHGSVVAIGQVPVMLHGSGDIGKICQALIAEHENRHHLTRFDVAQQRAQRGRGGIDIVAQDIGRGVAGAVVGNEAHVQARRVTQGEKSHVVGARRVRAAHGDLAGVGLGILQERLEIRVTLRIDEQRHDV